MTTNDAPELTYYQGCFLTTLVAFGTTHLFVSRKPVTIGSIALLTMVTAALARLIEPRWGARTEPLLVCIEYGHLSRSLVLS